jgi:hypothetical protein
MEAGDTLVPKLPVYNANTRGSRHKTINNEELKSGSPSPLLQGTKSTVAKSTFALTNKVKERYRRDFWGWRIHREKVAHESKD